jgi:hypothetical protein
MPMLQMLRRGVPSWHPWLDGLASGTFAQPCGLLQPRVRLQARVHLMWLVFLDGIASAHGFEYYVAIMHGLCWSAARKRAVDLVVAGIHTQLVQRAIQIMKLCPAIARSALER